MKQIRTLKPLQFLHQDLPEMFQLGLLPLLQKELTRKIVWLNNRGIRVSKCISQNLLQVEHFSVGRRASNQKYVLVLVTFGSNALDQRSGDGQLGGRS